MKLQIIVFVTAFAAFGCTNSEPQKKLSGDVKPETVQFSTEVTVNRPGQRTVSAIVENDASDADVTDVAKATYEKFRNEIEKSESAEKQKAINVFVWKKERYDASPRDGFGWIARVNSHPNSIGGQSVPPFDDSLVEWNRP